MTGSDTASLTLRTKAAREGDGYRLRMPYWVRVTRRGDRCTGAISPDGNQVALRSYTSLFLYDAEAFLRNGTDGDSGRARQIQVAWRNLVRELTHHHEAEDEHVWPFLRSRGVDLALLEEMESEHVAMKHALSSVSAGLDYPGIGPEHSWLTCAAS